MATRLRNISSWHIIWVFTLIGFLLGIVLSQEEYLTASRRPTQLEPLPVAAIRLQLIATDWLSVIFSVETVDGQIYSSGQSYVNEWHSHSWRLGQPQLSESYIDTHLGEACSRIIIKRFERHAGALLECRTVDVPAEFCPGPISSFAIDSQGNVWQTAQPRICFFNALFGVPLLTAVGFVAGVILVSLRWLIIRVYQMIKVKP